MKKTVFLACSSALALLAAIPAHAAIIGTYVDANPDASLGAVNTTPASAFPAGFTYVDNFNDNLWDLRHFAGPGPFTNTTADDIIEAGNNANENPATLTTAVAVANHDYDAYVLFWSGPTFNWEIQSALTGNTLQEFTKSNSFNTGVNLGPGVAFLYEAYLGRVFGTSNISVAVQNATPNGDRTWYDGIAFVSVPEPASLALLTLAAPLLLRRRKCN